MPPRVVLRSRAASSTPEVGSLPVEEAVRRFSRSPTAAAKRSADSAAAERLRSERLRSGPSISGSLLHQCVLLSYVQLEFERPYVKCRGALADHTLDGAHAGRGKLNLRAPGPERAPAESHCVSSAITAEQASEKTSEHEAPSLDTVASVPPVETAFGAPVVRELPPDPGPHERLLTVREVASRLGVSSALVYKLCQR